MDVRQQTSGRRAAELEYDAKVSPDVGHLITKSIGDVMIVRGERLNESVAKSIVRELRQKYVRPTQASAFLGPVRIEAIGDAIMLRGGSQDLDRLVRIIREVEALHNDSLLSRLETSKTRDQELAKYYLQSHPERVRARKEEIANLEALLLALKLRDEKLADRFATEDPQRKDLAEQIARIERIANGLQDSTTSSDANNTDTSENQVLNTNTPVPQPEEKTNQDIAKTPRPVVRSGFQDDREKTAALENKADLDRVGELIRRYEEELAGQAGAGITADETASATTPSDAKSKVPGLIQFEIHADGHFNIRGAKADVDRVTKALSKDSKTLARATPTNREQQAAAPHLTAPVRIEFLEGTDIFIVRGKKEDVDRIMEVINPRKLSDYGDLTPTTKSPPVSQRDNAGRLPSEPAWDGTNLQQDDVKNRSAFVAYQLRNAIADKVAEVLQEVLGDQLSPDSDPEPIIQADNANNKIVVRAARKTHPMIRKLIAELDRPVVSDQKIFTRYKLRHIKATRAKALLQTMQEDDESNDNRRIIADSRTNSLLIYALPKAHQEILENLQAIQVTERSEAVTGNRNKNELPDD